MAYLTNFVHLFTYPFLEMSQAYEVWPENSTTSYTDSESPLHLCTQEH